MYFLVNPLLLLLCFESIVFSFRLKPIVHHHILSRTLYSQSTLVAGTDPVKKEIISEPPEQKCKIPLKIVTFNILAPCYKRIKEKNLDLPGSVEVIPSGTGSPRIYESSQEPLFMERNRKIIEQLISTQADIICLQEFWTGSPALLQLYVDHLCQTHGYSMKILERTSHWRSRKDGLAVFVKNENIYIEDVREILFHDCGDRVALMLVLSLLPGAIQRHLPSHLTTKALLPQRFICVNTHLLFPHNADSTKIRLREITKILGYVDSYRQKELLPSDPVTTINSLSHAPNTPIIVTGDFNGSPNGKVYQLLKQQNYCSACEVTASNQQLNSWISHQNHLNTNVFVDHVFFLNPTDQELPSMESSPMKGKSNRPDWTNLVFQEVLEKIKTKFDGKTMRDVFNSFDQDCSNYITREEFIHALEQLGFQGENSPALTPDEMEVLLKSADINDDGLIDYKEFYDRFWIADEELQSRYGRNHYDEANVLAMRQETSASPTNSLVNSLQSDNTNEEAYSSQRFSFARSNFLSSRSKLSPTSSSSSLSTSDQIYHKLVDAIPLGNLQVQSVTITPKCLEEGCWPNDYELSDHGMVECIFDCEVVV